MKLRELIRLNEEETTVQRNVTRLNQLKGKDGKFLVGTVNVTGYVYLGDMDLDRLPVRFGTVGRWFTCGRNLLTTLQGAPGIVGEDFDCGNNQLTSLEGVPRTISGDFYCSGNWLTTLEGAPRTVGGNFYCHKNRLTSLVGVHRIIKQIGAGLNFTANGIEHGGIGLILVEGLTEISADQPAFEIINKYLGQGKRGVLLCQEALHEAGYGEFARL